MDVLERMNDHVGVSGTATRGASSSSGNHEPSRANAHADFSDSEDASTHEVERILKLLGITPCSPSEPLLPVPRSSPSTSSSDQPPVRRNQFWRLLSSREPRVKLTSELLAPLSKSAEPCAESQDGIACPMSKGEWLAHFKMHATAVPVRHVATCIWGDDVGKNVACLIGLDDLGMRSESRDCSVAAGDSAHGERVIASRNRPCASLMGEGRLGFLAEDEVSISTPSDSSQRFMTDDTPQRGKPFFEAFSDLWSRSFQGEALAGQR